MSIQDKEQRLTKADKEALELTYRSLVFIRNIARSNTGGLDQQQTQAIFEVADACHNLPNLLDESDNPMLENFSELTKSALDSNSQQEHLRAVHVHNQEIIQEQRLSKSKRLILQTIWVNIWIVLGFTIIDYFNLTKQSAWLGMICIFIWLLVTSLGLFSIAQLPSKEQRLKSLRK